MPVNTTHLNVKSISLGYIYKQRQMQTSVIRVFRQQSDNLGDRWNKDKQTDKKQNLNIQTQL